MDATNAARGLKIVADPTRARILSLMLESPDGYELVGRLAPQLGLTQPTVSHHVRALLEDGLLERSPHGRETRYSIAASQLDRVTELLGARDQAQMTEGVLERVGDDLAERFAGVFSAETVHPFCGRPALGTGREQRRGPQRRPRSAVRLRTECGAFANGGGYLAPSGRRSGASANGRFSSGKRRAIDRDLCAR